MRHAFIKKLEEFCSRPNDIFLMTGDLGYKLFDNFREKYKEKFINVGIAEPNMINIAAGMALCGKKVYCYSMIPFLISRCLEQIKINLCYNQADVKLIGVGCGLSYGAEGVTHHAIEDLAVLRALPGITILAPSDSQELEACMEATVSKKGPVFIRLGKNGEPLVHDKSIHFEIGKGLQVINTGTDICLIATGNIVYRAKAVSNILIKKGYGVTLISMPTIKPLDEALIKEIAKKYKFLISIEEHSIIGGLGSSIAEVLAEIPDKPVFKRIGLEDSFNRFVGKSDFLQDIHGLSIDKMTATILALLRGDYALES